MTKTFCDRCGKEIKKVDHRSIYAWITHRALYATLRMIGGKSEEGNWKKRLMLIYAQNVRIATFIGL